MSPAIFHPWVREQSLAAANQLRDALRQWPQTLFVLAAWALLGALVVFVARHVDGDRMGLVVEALVRRPAVAVLLIAAVGFGLVHAGVRTLRAEFLHGWWGAIPVGRGAQLRALALLGLLMGLGFAAVLAGALWGLAQTADLAHRWFLPALQLVAIAVPIGALAGLLSGSRGAVVASERGSDRGRGLPLRDLPAFGSDGLQSLSRWQRISALRHWRSAGGAWQFLLLGLVIPANEARASLAGFLIMGIALIWYLTVLRTGASVIGRAHALLAATPLAFQPFARATARYPLLASVIAGIACAPALALQGAPVTFLVAVPTLLLALTALTLALAWRYSRTPRRGDVRLGAELVLLGSIAQFAGPLVLLPYLALLVRHLHVANRNP